MARAAKKQKREFTSQHIEIGIAVIENPNWSRDHDGDKTNIRYVQQPINVRESAITTLAAKGVINAAQTAAADRFRHLWEVMGGAGAPALDYSKEPVDGGGISEPISIRQLEAGRALKAAKSELVSIYGEYGYRLVGYIAGEGRSIHELTETRRQRDTMTDNLRAYLDVLARLWKFSN
jgi:hypothetical protein